MTATDSLGGVRARGALLAGLALVVGATAVLVVDLVRASSVVLDTEHAYAWLAVGGAAAGLAAVAVLFGSRSQSTGPSPSCDELDRNPEADETALVLSRASQGSMLAAASVVVLAVALVHASATASAPTGPSRGT